MNKKHYIFIFIGLLLLTFIGWRFLFVKQQAKQSAPAIPVTAKTTKLDTIKNYIEAIGTAKANESVNLTSKITEHVTKFNFKDGQHVKQGDILVELMRNEQLALLNDAAAILIEAKKHYQRIETLRKRRVTTAAELDAQRMKVDVAQAKVDQIKARLRNHFIIAPFDGVLGFRKVSVGTLVEPGTEITTIDDIDTIKVDFTIPEKYLGKVHVGQSVVALTDAYPDQEFKGKIASISPRIDPISRALTLRAKITNPEHRLRPGMLMSIDIITGQHKAVVIPESAIVSINDQHFVFIIKSNNQVLQQNVKLGQRRFGYVEVTQGLKPNQLIVIDGNFKLQPGMTVKVVS